MSEHAPGPWEAKNRSGAGWQIDCVLPAGFKFDGTARGADGQKSFMTWTIRETHTVQIADERWVQFSTGSWEKMQAANARLISAAPDMADAIDQALDDMQDSHCVCENTKQQLRAALAKAIAHDE